MGIRWAFTGLETEVSRGFSWLPMVTRRDTKTLVDTESWGDSFEHTFCLKLRTPLSAGSKQWSGWSALHEVVDSLVSVEVVECCLSP